MRGTSNLTLAECLNFACHMDFRQQVFGDIVKVTIMDALQKLG